VLRLSFCCAGNDRWKGLLSSGNPDSIVLKNFVFLILKLFFLKNLTPHQFGEERMIYLQCPNIALGCVYRLSFHQHFFKIILNLNFRTKQTRACKINQCKKFIKIISNWGSSLHDLASDANLVQNLLFR
jgi:hypothetical protein